MNSRTFCSECYRVIICIVLGLFILVSSCYLFLLFLCRVLCSAVKLNHTSVCGICDHINLYFELEVGELRKLEELRGKFTMSAPESTSTDWKKWFKEPKVIGVTCLVGISVIGVGYYFVSRLKKGGRIAKVQDKINTIEDEEKVKSSGHWGYLAHNGPSHWYEIDPIGHSLCKDGKKQSPINIDTGKVSAELGDSSEVDDIEKEKVSKIVKLDCDKVLIHYPSISNGFLINNGHTIMIHSNNDFNFDKSDEYTEINPSHHKHHIIQSSLFAASKQMALKSVNMEYDGYIIISNVKYYLEQFHFHSPSEHCIDNKYCDLELHFVHQSDGNELAVLGVLFKVDESNVGHEFLNQFWKYLPSTQNGNKEYFFKKHLNNFKLDMKCIENEISNGSLLCYHGSLTTPPCSEGVKWFVLKQVQKISPSQLRKFRQCLNGINNVRPVQDIHNRVVTLCSHIQSC